MTDGVCYADLLVSATGLSQVYSLDYTSHLCVRVPLASAGRESRLNTSWSFFFFHSYDGLGLGLGLVRQLPVRPEAVTPTCLFFLVAGCWLLVDVWMETAPVQNE